MQNIAVPSIEHFELCDGGGAHAFDGARGNSKVMRKCNGDFGCN